MNKDIMIMAILRKYPDMTYKEANEWIDKIRELIEDACGEGLSFIRNFQSKVHEHNKKHGSFSQEEWENVLINRGRVHYEFSTEVIAALGIKI